MSSVVSRVSAASQRLVLRVMSSSLNLLHQFEGTRDVAILVSLVTAAKQHDNRVAAPYEINPVARTVIDPHLRHAAAHGPGRAGTPRRQAAGARNRARASR